MVSMVFGFINCPTSKPKIFLLLDMVQVSFSKYTKPQHIIMQVCKCWSEGFANTIPTCSPVEHLTCARSLVLVLYLKGNG